MEGGRFAASRLFPFSEFLLENSLQFVGDQDYHEQVI